MGTGYGKKVQRNTIFHTKKLVLKVTIKKAKETENLFN